MDNGVVVALSSFASAVVAGSITLLGKLIDTIQKRNEQTAAIQNTYISEKIKAGQNFVSRNNVLVYNFYYQISHLEEMKATGKTNTDILAAINDIQKSLKDNYLKHNDFTELFYDITESNSEFDSVMYKLGEHAIILNDSLLGSDRFKEQASIIISLYKKATEIILRGSANVRNELKVYDIK